MSAQNKNPLFRPVAGLTALTFCLNTESKQRSQDCGQIKLGKSTFRWKSILFDREANLFCFTIKQYRFLNHFRCNYLTADLSKVKTDCCELIRFGRSLATPAEASVHFQPIQSSKGATSNEHRVRARCDYQQQESTSD